MSRVRGPHRTPVARVHAIERDLYGTRRRTGKKIDDPRGKHYNAIHTAKKHDPRQKNYGKNTMAKTRQKQQKAKTRQKQQAKCATRRKYLGGQKWTSVGKNARWPVVGKNDSSRGASYTDRSASAFAGRRRSRTKNGSCSARMDLVVGKNGPWWARTVAQEARRTRERLCTRSMRLVIRMVGEGL